MRFIYLDPALVHAHGASARFCLLLRQELRNRGIPSRIFANAQATQDLRDKLGAYPLFRSVAVDPDPVIGWLTSFKMSTQSIYQDLSRIGGLAAEDVVYLRLPGPAALMALVQWATGVGPHRLPIVVVDVGWDPGLEWPSAKNRGLLELRDPRRDARAVLYAYAACRIAGDWESRLRFVVFDRALSGPFRAVLGRPVETLPMPISAGARPRRRGATRPITIALLGHQRPEHGYHLAPAIAQELLRRRKDIHVLVHNSAPEEMPVPQRALRELAHRDRRLTLVEGAVNDAFWDDLIMRADLVVCPYDPGHYSVAHSPLVPEMIANAIPLVIPEQTSLAQSLKEFDNPCETFDTLSSDSVVAAVERAIDRLDRHASTALAAAVRWTGTRGPTAMMEALLALTQASTGPITIMR